MSTALRHRAIGLGLITAAVLAGCSDTAPAGPSEEVARPALSRAAPTFRFTSIEVPGATMTAPQGINAAGQVVGAYNTADGRQHGFVMEGAAFTTIDYPDAFYTNVRGIGPNGEVVGNFAGESEPGVASHGFRMNAQGEFTAVHYEGHDYEILQRLLPDGTILGCRHDDNTTHTMRGIVITALGGTSEIDTHASMHNGATPDRSRIVGLYTNVTAGRVEGYTIDNGVFATLLVPGALMTSAWDVNPRGDIVGIFRDAAGFHGFIWTEAGPTTLDFPGAAHTRAFGVNARGDVVGTYVMSGVTRGFMATRVK